MGYELNIIGAFGVQTGVTVGTTTTQVLAANTRRTWAQISNASNEGVWVKFGTAAVMNEGVYIPPNGGVFVIDEKSNLWRGTVNAICTTGGKVVGVVEGQ